MSPKPKQASYKRPAICALKATVNYHRPIVWRLAESDFELRLVSLLALAWTREALYNGCEKHNRTGNRAQSARFLRR